MIHRPSDAELEEFLGRGIAEVIVREDLRRMLASGERRLRIKQGFDPTHPNLHLGHAVPLRKLRTLARWGHEIVLIVGDWTTQIGDPTDRELTRPMKTREEVMASGQTYIDQFNLIVPKENTRIVLQDEWYGTFGLRDVLQLTARFTVQQMLAREEFQKRIDAKTAIPIKDILYPLLQAYDSVAIEADVEVGGTDQLFNILAGRELQQDLGQRPQQVYINQLLEGLDGEKMSKSKPQTAIWLVDAPGEVYGKVMSIRDDLMRHYFEWATEMPMAEVEAALALHPREAKRALARRIVTELHSAEVAGEAEEAFDRQFRRGEAPSSVERPTLAFREDPVGIVDLVVALKKARNKAEARSLIAAGGVEIDGTPATLESTLAKGARHRVRVGRTFFEPTF